MITSKVIETIVLYHCNFETKAISLNNAYFLMARSIDRIPE